MQRKQITAVTNIANVKVSLNRTTTLTDLPKNPENKIINLYLWRMKKVRNINEKINEKNFTAWKVSKYGVFSGPYFPAFGLNKLHIWTFFRQCFVVKFKPFWKNSRIEGFILLAWVPSEITKIGNLLMKRQSCHHIETSQLICSAN